MVLNTSDSIRFRVPSSQNRDDSIRFDSSHGGAGTVRSESRRNRETPGSCRFGAVVLCQRADSIRFRISAACHAILYGWQPLESHPVGFGSDRVVTEWNPIRFDSNRSRYESYPIPSHSRRIAVRFDSSRAQSQWVTVGHGFVTHRLGHDKIRGGSHRGLQTLQCG